MNEKLKQEVAFFKCIGDNDLRDLTRIAEHFYDLALEEVWKECERRIRHYTKLAQQVPDGHVCSHADYIGRKQAIEDFLRFVDNLTK